MSDISENGHIALGAGRQFKCEYSIMESLGFIILWVILTIVTLGLGSFVAFYYFNKAIINKTWIVDVDGRKVGRLTCDLNLAEMIGHILIWILITIVTFGFGFILYAFRTFRLCLNKTYITQI